MLLEIYFQQSLFGKTLWEVLYQETGLIMEPCLQLSQGARFQCLLLDAGPTPEWLEGPGLTLPGGSWTPNIGQAPGWPEGRGFSWWRILEGGVLPKYCLSPGQCSTLLSLAAKVGIPPPREIEALLLKQGGVYPRSGPFRCTG